MLTFPSVFRYVWCFGWMFQKSCQLKSLHSYKACPVSFFFSTFAGMWMCFNPPKAKLFRCHCFLLSVYFHRWLNRLFCFPIFCCFFCFTFHSMSVEAGKVKSSLVSVNGSSNATEMIREKMRLKCFLKKKKENKF